MTLEQILNEIADRGWLVNNLFQLDSGLWQANLRSATHHTKFAVADSPDLVLALCLDQIEIAIESEVHVIKSYDEPAIDLRSILFKNRPAFARRI